MQTTLNEDEEVYYLIEYDFDANIDRVRRLKQYMKEHGRNFTVVRRYSTYIKYNVILTRQDATFIHLTYGDIIGDR